MSATRGKTAVLSTGREAGQTLCAEGTRDHNGHLKWDESMGAGSTREDLILLVVFGAERGKERSSEENQRSPEGGMARALVSDGQTGLHHGLNAWGRAQGRHWSPKNW